MASLSHLAAIRFGTGPRPGVEVPADPLPWLDAQTRPPGPPLPLPEGRDTPHTYEDGFAAWRAHDASPPAPGVGSPVTAIHRAEQTAWVRHLLVSDEPFRDRLTLFWLNHFTVAERAGFGVQLGYGPYLRDCIRPHVGGRFLDMLTAVATSPPMLYYLDQAGSIGPNSLSGRRGGRSMNENLAREILELHSLSPAGGYTQADVTEFAKIMTGWGVERIREPRGTIFRGTNHEPGEKRLLGTVFAEGPEAYAGALRLIATHPATYRHIATRMVRHFLADMPPAGAVDRIARTLSETEGDLGAAARALIRLPQAWTPVLVKLRSHQEYLVAIHRAGGASDPAPVQGSMANLGQPLWNPPQPNGWPETAAAWTAPEPVMQRLDLAFVFAQRFARQDPRAVLELALGPLARPETRTAVERAASPRDAIALIFASPEMQRR